MQRGSAIRLILEIHGGPFAAYGPHFSTDNQLYAAAGYAVLSVNPRGSTSYGAEFANLIHHAYPGNDYDDLISAVDAAIAQGFADPERLFVTGGSGGGVLTAWIVGRTNRFRAAATQKPVIDWSSFALTADGPAFFSRYWFGAYPWEDPRGLLAALAAVAGRQCPDADPGRRRQRGLSHPGQRGRAILYGAAAARRADGAGEGARRQPWRHCGAAVAERRQGGRDPRLVRALPERRAPRRRLSSSALRRRGARQDVGEPGAGLALGLGDLARGHVLGDVGPAFLRHDAAVQGREVEPFVRFDEVDLDAAAAGRISDAELVERLDVAASPRRPSGFRSGTLPVLQTVTHLTCPPLCCCRVMGVAQISTTNG